MPASCDSCCCWQAGLSHKALVLCLIPSGYEPEPESEPEPEPEPKFEPEPVTESEGDTSESEEEEESVSRARRMQEARRLRDEMMKHIGWDLETTYSPTTSGNGVHIDSSV